MAQFDLKQAEIVISDGYSKTGAVNNAAGYIIGVATMTIDGITGILPNGLPFKLAGDDQVYSITAHTETTGNTTSITFTPPLAMAATDNQVITFGPNFLRVVLGEGNLTYSEKRPLEYMRDRGKLDTVRLGNEDPVDVRLDARWEFISSSAGAAVPTIEEALKQKGPAAGWISSSDDLCEPYAVDIQIRYSPFCTTEEKELIILPDYRWESMDHDAKAGTISTTGKCNVVEATATRVTAF
jgi:hypothetical protein